MQSRLFTLLFSLLLATPAQATTCQTYFEILQNLALRSSVVQSLLTPYRKWTADKTRATRLNFLGGNWSPTPVALTASDADQTKALHRLAMRQVLFQPGSPETPNSSQIAERLANGQGSEVWVVRADTALDAANREFMGQFPKTSFPPLKNGALVAALYLQKDLSQPGTLRAQTVLDMSSSEATVAFGKLVAHTIETALKDPEIAQVEFQVPPWEGSLLAQGNMPPENGYRWDAVPPFTRVVCKIK